MKRNCLFSIALLPILLLGSCSRYGSHYLIKNLDSYFTDNVFEEFDMNTVENMMSTNNEFMLYMSSTGCSSCEVINEVLRGYLPNNKVLMYNLDYTYQQSEADLFFQKYGNRFKFEFPSLYIVKGENVTQIPSSKLNTSGKISNTFSEYQHSCNLYFSNQNALELLSLEPNKSPLSTFGYVAFNFDNKELLNVYNTNLSTYIEQLLKPILLVNYEEKIDEIFIANLSLNSDGKIGCRKQTTTKDFSNIGYIKEILNF